ncbi:methionine aminotransferase [Crenobacter sp. SG2303]|uniref:Putative 8-amino-7-oxononanoate synthase n=1 Tax=Crenobacter oryzisoli TaxID=3056844 RepID=A0ABT7XK82_9NEIS|nr:MULTISPECIES: methionine aminotransferase [unclassified Crenobacter]MDN0074123.1 methionine aminotransferase [Crenobacter sp. SG2303]MDN0085104.1 methionine aminotransferase [Crenobacter sp. SG2305]
MSTPTLRSKLPAVGTTIFTVIGQLSAQYKAINLSQGAPNFPCDPALIRYAHEAMLAGHNQYAPMTGLPALREALAAKAEALYGHTYDPADEVTVMASASEALFSAVTALVHPGDEVIIFEPAFDSYAPMVELQGAIVVPVKLNAPEFAIPWDEVAAKISPRTRMIVLNTPHNPTGTVLGEADIAALTRLTDNTDIVILSDEVYEHVVFDGQLHHGMSRHPKLAERAVVVGSFGKTFHVTGWRVGFCMAPAALMDEVRKVHQFAMFAADTPMQHALAKIMQQPDNYLGLAAFYQQKRDLLVDALKDSRLKLHPSAGSFFLLAEFGHLSDETDSQFVQRLIREHGVSTIPVSAFYSDGTDARVIRLSFAKDDATLLAAAERLCRV